MNNDRITALEQQLAAIQAEIDQLKAEDQSKEVKPWRAELSTRYSRIQPEGFVHEYTEHGNFCDNAAYSFGNYYRTYALAEQDAKELALRGRVRQLRDALCEGYQFVPNRQNFCILYDVENSEYDVGFLESNKAIGEIYFDTEEHAQTVCDILNAEMGKESGE